MTDRELLTECLNVITNDTLQRTFAGGVRISQLVIKLRAVLAEPQHDQYDQGYSEGYAAGYENGDSEGFTRGSDTTVDQALARINQARERGETCGEKTR